MLEKLTDLFVVHIDTESYCSPSEIYKSTVLLSSIFETIKKNPPKNINLFFHFLCSVLPYQKALFLTMFVSTIKKKRKRKAIVMCCLENSHVFVSSLSFLAQNSLPVRHCVTMLCRK